jgi:hypothetical protein
LLHNETLRLVIVRFPEEKQPQIDFPTPYRGDKKFKWRPVLSAYFEQPSFSENVKALSRCCAEICDSTIEFDDPRGMLRHSA